MNTPTAWNLARRWGWLLLLAALAGGAIAYALTGMLTPTYRSSATLLVAPQQQEGTLQRADLETSVLLATTYTELITIRPVLERAAATGRVPLSPGEIADHLEVTQNGQLIVLTANHEDPGIARDIANVVAETFIASPEASLGGGQGAQGTPALALVEPAQTPSSPEGPGRLLNAMLGALLGFGACLGLVALYEYLDRAVTRPHQVASLTGLPTLGRLPEGGRARRPAEMLAVSRQPDSRLAEEYRALRTTLKHTLMPDEGVARRVVAVTSPAEGEGKTTAVANLAVVFGLAGYRVLVIDADLRRPSLHQVFGVENREGLTTLLTASRPRADHALQGTSHHGVSVIASGPPSALRVLGAHSNPADVLGSPEFRALLDDVREQFDLVLVDTSSVLEASDAAAVADAADALVIVIRAGQTDAEELRDAVERLGASEAPIAGVILNRVRAAHERNAHGPLPNGASIVSLPVAHGGRRERPTIQPATFDEPRS